MFIPGLVSITFRQLAPAEIIKVCQANGLQAIEWGGDVHVPPGDLLKARAVGEHTRDEGLSISAYGSYYRASQSEAAGLPFSAVLDTASELGAKAIRVWSGTVGSAEATDEQRDWIVADLQRICDLAAPRGITIATEFHANTITDTAETTLDVLSRVTAGNLQTFWQPPNGRPPAESIAGLKTLLPKVSNVHVFHWWPLPADRHPLAAGEPAWMDYLAVLQDETPRFASLEFVKGDHVEQLADDARTLRTWISELAAMDDDE